MEKHLLEVASSMHLHACSCQQAASWNEQYLQSESLLIASKQA